ncbi:MAG: hypothetical protein A2020_03350 [Lentisphaerae bacterium GWF2_45_14]|nr:MAG: hypothetical protein A2020_03350 [Lentisphaerae bacterium GWF2_45_14]
MKINYRTFRRIIFSIYIFITIVFCILMLHIGKREIERARLYTESEKNFAESLYSCREILNNVEHAFYAVSLNPLAQNTVSPLLYNVKRLRDSVGTLKIFGPAREKRPSAMLLALEDKTRLLLSTVNAFQSDLAEGTQSERNTLAAQDTAGTASALTDLRASLQTLLRSEMENVGTWQQQSLFFFNRLQYLLILFFVLTAIFTFAASSLSSHFLRISLRELSDGTKKISSDPDYRFKSIKSDEIGSLMHDFNEMAERLQKQSGELRTANTQLERKAEELMEARRQRDNFMSNMNHELRTPLNSIIGFAELIIERAPTIHPDKVKDFANRILKASEHLLDLIADLLNLARIDAGVMAPAYSDFNLNDCLDEVDSMMRPVAAKKKLELNFICEDNFLIRGDRRFIKQIIINLLSNSLKFTHEGFVEVKAWKDSPKTNAIRVTDSGIGISEENQKLIFKDFHRVETGLTSNYEGVGIGLTLSKRLVELHGGSIIVSSSVGKGSTFTVFLPYENN